MKKLVTLLLTILAFNIAFAQFAQPITWKAEVVMDNATEGHVKLSATVEPNWHFYALSMPEEGPIPTTIKFNFAPGLKPVGELTPSIPPTEEFDEIFELNLGFWDKNVDFIQNFKVVKPGSNKVDVKVNFQSCNGESCIAPATEEFSLTVVPAKNKKKKSKK